MFKQKSVKTKDGRRYKIHETKLDKGVGATPNPTVTNAIKGMDKKIWNQEKKRRSNTLGK